MQAALFRRLNGTMTDDSSLLCRAATRVKAPCGYVSKTPESPREPYSFERAGRQRRAERVTGLVPYVPGLTPSIEIIHAMRDQPRRLRGSPNRCVLAGSPRAGASAVGRARIQPEAKLRSGIRHPT